ncbi:MAG: hypothetical protein HKN42_14815 [Granulosicoccus sp.]|nr:hypothetical protein [Granulosicoccus sp.]
MHRSANRLWTLLTIACMVFVAACASSPSIPPSASGNPDELLIVDCLLPGQVRQLGSKLTYLSPRRPVKTSAASCEIRGGEYVSFDRADAGTSLKIWLPLAEEGDVQAQTYVGEIFEKGLGVEPDYAVAARWYRQAATQGYSRAQINLGYLYESGLGVNQDLTQAMNLYRQASGIEEGSLEYVSTVEFAQREAARQDAVIMREKVEELSEQLAESEARYRSLQSQARTERGELATLRKQIEQKRREVATADPGGDAQASATTRALIEIESVQEQLATEASRNETLTAQLEASRAEISSLRSGLIADSQEVMQLKEKLAEQVNLIRSLEESLDASSAGNSQAQDRQALLEARDGAVTIKQAVNSLRQQNSALPASVLQALSDAEERELMLSSALLERTQALNSLRRKQSELESRYQASIRDLQSELSLSAAEQTRVAGRLADTELSIQSMENENKLLRDRLREQNEAVASREREQQRLTARLSAMALSEQASQAEKRAAEASTRVANAELALARFEQSRLVTRLVEAELNARQEKLDSARQLAILEKKLTAQAGIVVNQEDQLNTLEARVSEGRAQTELKASEAVTQVVALGPTIEIIEPPVLVTRGPGEIAARPDGSIELIGRVSPADRLLTFLINGERQSVNESGVFRFQSDNVVDTVELTAVDDQGERTKANFSVARRGAAPIAGTTPGMSVADEGRYEDIDFGRYHAIVIGNNLYGDISELRTAESDARVIDSLLRERYGFSTQLLINATKLEILQALDSARQTLTEQDNLIVYYAGHGQLDPDGAQGYWLPVDAQVDSSENWIANAVVTNYLDSIPAKQIMVVADSCFSGTLTKASIPRMQADMPMELRERWLRLMAKRKVRTVLSSGGIKPVYDGTAQHSLFASAFIDELSRNAGVLEGTRLFADLRQSVQRSATALGVDQTPQYAAIKFAGHEVGEFMFVAR